MTAPSYALLFPGQGSQYPGMAGSYLRDFAVARETLEEASDVLGQDVLDLCMSDPHGRLGMTVNTQPAVLSISTALHRVLRTHLGIATQLVAGHSLGEYAALVALGGLSFADALRTVRVRAEAMQQAAPTGTGMLAYIGSRGDRVQDYCARASRPESRIEVANFNGPRQLVLSGHLDALSRASDHIDRERLGSAVPLPVSAAFHSSLMEEAADELAVHLRSVPMRPLQGTLVANVDATAYTGCDYTPHLLVRQAKEPVLWLRSLFEVERLAPHATWIEVGPGAVLRGLARKAFPKKPCIAMDRDGAMDALRAELGVTSQAA